MDALTHMLKEAAKLEKAGEVHGWSVKTIDNSVLPDGVGNEVLVVDCTAVRGQEVIRIWWEDKHLIEAPTYQLAGHEMKLRNASACVQQMAKVPNFERAARKTKAKKDAGLSSENLQPDPDTLPWEYIEAATDAEILRACYAKNVVWINEITGETQTDVIVRSSDAALRKGNFNSTNYHISRSSSGRVIINFLGVFGYRSVAIDTILRVGSSQEAADRIAKEMIALEKQERSDRIKKLDKQDKAMR